MANVGAMLLPWLSTKDGDPDAAGRFGIGERTLSSLVFKATHFDELGEVSVFESK